jgi:PTH1 family peptidyl-tRNA hydrolase
MKAVVGLGNPGPDYAGTRHNLGFEVVDEIARRWRVKLKSWKSVASLAVVKSRDVILAEPKTFMNASGQAVGSVTRYYGLAPEDVLIVVDEAQLPLGRLRLRRSGSDGGHNGLKSIIEHLGRDFPRLRIGVERGDRASDLSQRVLSRFGPVERDAIDRAVVRAADAVEMFVSEGLLAAMNRFNAPDDPPVEEGSR